MEKVIDPASAVKTVDPVFGSWPMDEAQLKIVAHFRAQFDAVLSNINHHMPAHSSRYMALVKTKLEEACLFAVKGIAVPK